MARFIWFTYGNSGRDVLAAKAVVVHADSVEEAVRKVAHDVDGADMEDGSYAEEYGSSWFLQEVSDQEIR